MKDMKKLTDAEFRQEVQEFLKWDMDMRKSENHSDSFYQGRLAECQVICDHFQIFEQL
jgi:hypothetical protein